MESAMRRILLPASAALAACTPSSRDAAMSRLSPASETVTRDASASQNPDVSNAAVVRVQAAQGPIVEPVSAAENPAPPTREASEEAQGRRILSTAFVRVDAHGHLTVELRDGRVMILRDVAMRPADYCGVQVRGNVPGARYCGGYADVAAARPGGVGVSADPVSAAANPARDH